MHRRGGMLAIGVVLLLLSALIAIANWSLLLTCYRERRSGSMIPIVGGIAGLVGGLLVGSRVLLVTVIVIDPWVATLPIVIGTFVRRRGRTPRPGDRSTGPHGPA